MICFAMPASGSFFFPWTRIWPAPPRAKGAHVADACTVPRPDGAFYCLARVHTSLDPLALVERLIVDHRVAAVPGTAFGLTDGCYLRVSYGALGRETVAEGIARLANGLRALV